MRMPKCSDVVVVDAEPHSGEVYGGHNLVEALR